MGARGALRVPRGAKRGGFGGGSEPPMTLISHPGLREGDLPLAQTGAGGARDCRTRPGTARGHAEQSLHIGAPVQALALDALAVTGQDAAAHVGVERGSLDAELPRGLVGGQVLALLRFTHRSHGSRTTRSIHLYISAYS